MTDNPYRAVALITSMLVVFSACDKKIEGETVNGAAEVASSMETGNPADIAGLLIRQLVAQDGDRQVAVEINTEVLHELMTSSGQDEDLRAFKDPLLAARLFSPHIGLSAQAEFSVLTISGQPEEASGLFIALVQVSDGDSMTKMRMISEPDAFDRPTIWVLNDYEK